MTHANKEHFRQRLMSNPGKHEHDFAAFERYTKGCNFAPGKRLAPGCIFAPGCKSVLHTNKAKPISESVILETLAVFEANATA